MVKTTVVDQVPATTLSTTWTIIVTSTQSAAVIIPVQINTIKIQDVKTREDTQDSS